MKKIAVFTGAGVSQESGVPTFRDSKDGLWYNYKVEEVATLDGWKNHPVKVLEFHNMLRRRLKDAHPNDAHKALGKLEDKYEVTIITQNVDDLHERGGSTNILHLHGELLKARSTMNPLKLVPWTEDLGMDDKCEDGSRLRPHTVLFDEYPYNMEESIRTIYDADILIVIGTSFDISYTFNMMTYFQGESIYYVDPKPLKELARLPVPVKFIRKKAVEGVTKLVEKLLKEKKK